MVRYKTINTDTLDGIKKAEKLKDTGWKIGNIGFSSIVFYKEEKACQGKHKKTIKP